jgi:hypothetical protein
VPNTPRRLRGCRAGPDRDRLAIDNELRCGQLDLSLLERAVLLLRMKYDT